MDGVAPARQVLKLSGPPDVAAAVPFVVGFQPVESLVIIALKGPRRRSCTPCGWTCPTSTRSVRRKLADQPVHPHTMAATLKRNGAESALVVVLTESARCADEDLAGRALALELRDELAALDIPVRDAILVQDGRWFSYLCDNPDCCPHEGTLVAGPAQDRVLAELAFAGESPSRGVARRSRPRSPPRTGIRATGRRGGGRRHARQRGRHPARRGRPDSLPCAAAFQAVRAGQQPEPETVALCLLWLLVFPDPRRLPAALRGRRRGGRPQAVVPADAARP